MTSFARESLHEANDPSVFSPDYATARARFLEAAAQVGAHLTSYPVEDAHTLADDVPLVMDVAVVPGERSQRCVVVSSGLHGVEGFFGSAVQLALLRRWDKCSGPRFDGNLVLVHALNPSGFHYLRRCDANNVDLNRNFLASDESYTGLPGGYRALASLLNPPSPPTRLDVFPLRALMAICRHGLSQLKATVATGQYEFPRGLFFGGTQPAAATKIVQENVATWIGDAQHVVHVDLHTGLGKQGTAKLLLVEPAGDPAVAWFAEHFGRQAIEPLAASGDAARVAYAARGVMGAWLRAHFGAQRYRFLVAEFGTHSVLRVLAALRAENRAFHACPPGDPRLVRAQRELVECFCPASVLWRQRVLTRGTEIIERAQQAVMSIPGDHSTESKA